MNVYYVSENGFNGCSRRYVATLKEARAIRDSYNKESGYPHGHGSYKSTIEKVKLDTSKASILSMLNYEGGFEISSEEVA
tara:strand:- start:291 stop:530 length:240 start_codon:yes stop_codon:yes gene_type:complete